MCTLSVGGRFFFFFSLPQIRIAINPLTRTTFPPPPTTFVFLQKSTNAQIFLGVQSAKEISAVQVFHLKTKTQLNETLAQYPNRGGRHGEVSPTRICFNSRKTEGEKKQSSPGTFEAVSFNVLFLPAPVCSFLEMNIRYEQNIPPLSQVLSTLKRDQTSVHVGESRVIPCGDAVK